jgi:plastocyanin domain-containing protein
VTLGLIMFNRGMVLTGTGYDFASVANWVNRTAENLDARDQPNVENADGAITLRMDVTREGFEPSALVIKKGVPVRWIINVKELTECNRAIVIPKLGLQFDLHPGEQTVEFTPGVGGDILWSCWMGMLRGEFHSLDEAQPMSGTETPPSSSGKSVPFRKKIFSTRQ